MKFFFADSQDYIDPLFNFETEQYNPDRFVQRDDVYPHEYFESAPYDGMLVSRAIVGDESTKGHYTTAQAIRFRRDGANRFLRYDPKNKDGDLMGDCGAFSYLREELPPYTIEEMVEYYSECGFTLAVSIDHVILGYDETLDQETLFGDAIPAEWRRRFDLTMKLAESFLERTYQERAPFVPIGVTQGWSPLSYAQGVQRLSTMGYDYVALGGLVPLKSPQIHRILKEVRDVAPDTKLHLFGFTKADEIEDFKKYNLASFDSTSPMIRAFKDKKRNYFDGNKWYSAIRIPQADENLKFKKAILAGHKDQHRLRVQEQLSLQTLRAYALNTATREATMTALEAYGSEFASSVHTSAYLDVLNDRPWEQCDCKVCKEIGVDVMIFRGSNRNRRRGFHNLNRFFRKLESVRSNTNSHGI